MDNGIEVEYKQEPMGATDCVCYEQVVFVYMFKYYRDEYSPALWNPFFQFSKIVIKWYKRKYYSFCITR